MKNLILIIILCFSLNNIRAMEPALEQLMNTPIALPKEKELNSYLRSAGLKFDTFVSITKIHDRLGCSNSYDVIRLSPIEIIKIVDDSIECHNDPKHNRYRGNCWLWLQKEDRQKILQCILRNSPEIYQKLCEYEKSLNCNALQHSKL